MEKFVKWLESEPDAFHKAVLILIVLLANLSFSVLVWATVGKAIFIKYEIFSMPSDLIVRILATAMGEETLFRVIPLALTIFVFGKFMFGKRPYALVAVSIVFSLIFAGWHYRGLTGMLYLGFMGLSLSLLYLKTGGSNKKELSALVMCGIVHFAFDMILFR